MRRVMHRFNRELSMELESRESPRDEQFVSTVRSVENGHHPHRCLNGLSFAIHRGDSSAS